MHVRVPDALRALFVFARARGVHSPRVRAPCARLCVRCCARVRARLRTCVRAFFLSWCSIAPSLERQRAVSRCARRGCPSRRRARAGGRSVHVLDGNGHAGRPSPGAACGAERRPRGHESDGARGGGCCVSVFCEGDATSVCDPRAGTAEIVQQRGRVRRRRRLLRCPRPPPHSYPENAPIVMCEGGPLFINQALPPKQ